MGLDAGGSIFVFVSETMKNRKAEQNNIEEKRLNLQRMKIEVLNINEILSVPLRQRIRHKIGHRTDEERKEEAEKWNEGCRQDIELMRRRQFLASQIQDLEKEVRSLQREVATKNPLLRAYIRACEKSRNAKPTLNDLVMNSKISRSKWQRELRNPTFVYDLGNEIKKKLNLAKVKKQKEFWVSVSIHIQDLQGKAAKRLSHSSRQRTIRDDDRPEPPAKKWDGKPLIQPGDEQEEELEEN